ncbi:MAG: hypothetical protein HC784_01560 [Hydrococcus sp. CSU_1_8]|nr:hypothetical protein [Hydrococcus sp. CSU_1_8]
MSETIAKLQAELRERDRAIERLRIANKASLEQINNFDVERAELQAEIGRQINRNKHLTAQCNHYIVTAEMSQKRLRRYIEENSIK